MRVSERNVFFRVIGKLISGAILLAALFAFGIAAASWIKGTTFTAEWANMVVWFSTWAK